MLALHRRGRSADALARYQEAGACSMRISVSIPLSIAFAIPAATVIAVTL